MKKQFGVGILGFGTVGAGVAKGLIDNAELMAQRSGFDIVVKGIADLDITSDRGVAVDPSVLTTDAMAMINDPEIDILVELVGGTTIAKKFMLEAFKAGKPVVTANKALLAECGDEVFGAAKDAGVDLYYEASVAGGIPLIKSLREGLVGNNISSIFGILNGTCNYILTRMVNEGVDFDPVLKEAQEAGFAEAEPSLDIDGHDTAHKIVLLASLAFGHAVTLDEINISGIRGMDRADLDYAAQMGYCVKLLAVLKNSEGGIEVRVHPTLIPSDHMLAQVSGPMNAAFVQGDLVGETMFYGPGAGRFPTASAVIGDVVDVARNLSYEAVGRLPNRLDYAQGAQLLPAGDAEVRYYLRLNLTDHPGTLSKVAETLGHNGISLASVNQQEGGCGEFVPVIMITQDCRTAAFEEAVAALGHLDCVGPGVVSIIIEDI